MEDEKSLTRLRAVSNNEMQMSDCNAPVRARLVTEPYRRILKTPSYAGGYLLLSGLIVYEKQTLEVTN